MSLFPTYIERVLSHEGGYVNNPADPGGETQWGIAKRSYPTVDIKALTRQGAIAIYERDFWVRVHGDELPQALAFQALDAAVNHGIGNSVRWMQRAAGVADDGYFGPITKAAILAADENDLLMRFNAIRLDFYTRLSTWPTFGRGWARRVAENLLYAAKDNTQ
jgi:lysozyme family protein